MDPLDITDKERLLEMLAQRRKGKSRIINEQEMNSSIKRRVMGQDHIIDDLCQCIRLQWGKEQRDRPIANLLFVGPPGTGKTELASALTEYLFEDEKHMLRFDCGEFTGVESKTRLVGTPTGYVGATQGGQLTRPMFSNPRRVILFDEIEKSYSGVLDLMLSMMGEGRLTEQASGKVADFTQSIIILTSNHEHENIGRLIEQFDDPYELGNAVRMVLKDSKKFRPELISRIDHVCVFRPLDDDTMARIIGLKIVKAAQQYGVIIKHVAPEIVFDILTLGDGEKDARQLTRHVDLKLGELLLEAKEQAYACITITLDEHEKPQINQVEGEN